MNFSLWRIHTYEITRQQIHQLAYYVATVVAVIVAVSHIYRAWIDNDVNNKLRVFIHKSNARSTGSILWAPEQIEEEYDMIEMDKDMPVEELSYRGTGTALLTPYTIHINARHLTVTTFAEFCTARRSQHCSTERPQVDSDALWHCRSTSLKILSSVRSSSVLVTTGTSVSLRSSVVKTSMSSSSRVDASTTRSSWLSPMVIGNRSVHAFVDKKNGDVHKAASFKSTSERCTFRSSYHQ